MTHKANESVQRVFIERFEPHQMPSIGTVQHQYSSTVSIEQIIGIVQRTEELNQETKDFVLEVIDKHSEDKFRCLQDFLDIGFSTDVIESLQACHDILQLFM
ncbi:hypothetical protein A9Q81_28160 [Gammaproteobacteria bacterium 42_54_T18]|nr:hypothetical protein A9Q81_28160 [Gammaproteobacteria bacterium 42_54_T18]